VTVGVVVVAAGRGERLAGGRPKALVELRGTSLLAHSLERLAAAGLAEPVVVHTPGEAATFQAAIPAGRVGTWVPGGATRGDSVRAGVAALPADVTVVAVHDAARALVPADVVRRVVAAVQGEVVAAAPAVPVADTLKRIATPLAGDEAVEVLGTVDREGLAAVQTPQVFRRPVLERALATGADATDELALVEGLVRDGTVTGRVVVVPGSPRAMKVTYPDDLLVAAALLDAPEVAM
jgi:2-C-methyl-D-erythritol 4-phosphate cytidylyltransferase